jgi:hypothetical protein
MCQLSVYYITAFQWKEQTVKYSASIWFGHEEAGTWKRLASPAVRGEQYQAETKC